MTRLSRDKSCDHNWLKQFWFQKRVILNLLLNYPAGLNCKQSGMITLSTGQISIHWKAQLVFPKDSDLSVKLRYVAFEHPILGLDPWIGLCNQTGLFVCLFFCLFFVHWKSLTFDFRRPELSYRSRARVRFISLLRQKCASQNNFRERCCSNIGFGVEPDHRCGK